VAVSCIGGENRDYPEKIGKSLTEYSTYLLVSYFSHIAYKENNTINTLCIICVLGTNKYEYGNKIIAEN
jgi:hypothetical protein